MKHKRFVITISFEVCEGMQAKMLDELRKLRQYTLGDAHTPSIFSHVTELKFDVSHIDLK